MKTINEVTTTDLAQFGAREKAMAGDLLLAMSDKGLPLDFYDDQVTVMMNRNSGNVFLTNSDYQVAMLTDAGNLESFYSCPQCGHEGFFKDMHPDTHVENQYGDFKECKRYYKDIKACRKAA